MDTPVETDLWELSATMHEGANGEQFTYECPAGGQFFSVWGAETYTNDSSVCTAAVHAGVITSARGGTVTIEIRPGQTSYAGTSANGVASQPWGAWSGSYVFVD